MPTNTTSVRKATVVLRAGPLTEVDDGYGRESCHMSGVEMNEVGVWFDWGDELGGKSFFPWSNVVRVDVEGCVCVDCLRDAKELRLAS